SDVCSSDLLHVRDHSIRRFSAVTHIDRSVLGIIFGRRIVTPCRIPVAVVPEVVTATDQLHAIVTRSIPALIVPFGMIRAEHFILRTLPLFASLNPIILVEGNRRNLLRLWLRAKVRMLRFDLLHLLRVRLLRLGPHIRLCVLLARCRNGRSCTCRSGRGCRSSRCLRRRGGALHPFPPLFSLLLGTGRRRTGRLTGNTRSRRGGSCRFLVRPSLPTFSCARLIRRCAGRLTGNIRFRGGRRFLARWSFSSLFCTGLSRSSALGRRATFLHRSGLLRGRGLRLRRFPLRLLCFSRARFFRG